MKPRRTSATFVWRGILAMVVAIATTMAATTAEAVPSGIMFAGANPVDGSTLFVARTAADNPLDPPTFQLKATIFLNNNGTVDREVDAITVSYPGTSINPQPQDVAIRRRDVSDPNKILVDTFAAAGVQNWIFINDGLTRDLPTPPPPQVQISIDFANDSQPLL